MKQILNETNVDYAKECFKEAIDLGINFKIHQKVKKRNFDKNMLNKLLEIPTTSSEPLKVVKEFKKEILPYCTNFSDVKFMGFPDAGNSIGGISGALISDLLQQNLINSSFCAPIATFTEIAVVKWLREIIGYKVKPIKNIWDVGGIITYGGTGSNATAMLLARENHNKKTMTNGVNNPKDYKVIIPKGIGHYSIKSSLMWIGCGDNVIEVETEGFKYNLSKLKEALIENKGKIMSVVVYVGDSRTMTIENLTDVYNLVKSIDSNIWLHADACHGFSLAFSKKLKNKIKGIELYDSISTDPHKVLAIPYCISALLVKNTEKLKLITSTSDLIMQEDFAYGQITPFIGSKSWVSLKLWFAMKSLGVEGIGKMIEKRCDIATYLKEQIIKNDKFVLLNEVNINSVVFMYIGNNINDVEYLNNLNLKIYNYLLDEGKYYLHKFSLPDDKGIIKKDATLIPLRYMSGNNNITEKDIDEMLRHIVKVARKVENE